MRRQIIALALLASLAGCWVPREAAYSPAAIERPQSLEFFYGTVVDVEPATVDHLRWAAASAYRPAGREVLQVPFGVLFDILAPNLPAIEYTVLLDKGRVSPDYYRPQPRPAVLVVQSEIPGERRLERGERAFVRVVGYTGRVKAADTLMYGAEQRLSAGPMQVPPFRGPSLASRLASPGKFGDCSGPNPPWACNVPAYQDY